MEQTIILADKQDITRLGIKYVIGSIQSEVKQTVFKEVYSRKELEQRLEEYPCSIVVLDYALFDFDCINQLQSLIERLPNTHWVLFSNEMDEVFIRSLASENNVSILFKNSTERDLIQCLNYATRYERFLSQSVTNILLAALSRREEQHEKLTSAEVEVLKLIAHGKSVKEIATIRISSVHTITTHKKNIFRKLNVNTVYAATKYAIRNGLVDPIEYYI